MPPHLLLRQLILGELLLADVLRRSPVAGATEDLASRHLPDLETFGQPFRRADYYLQISKDLFLLGQLLWILIMQGTPTVEDYRPWANRVQRSIFIHFYLGGCFSF